MSDPAWWNLLETYKVQDVIDPNKILVKAEFGAEMKELMQQLKSANVLSAVIYDPVTPGLYGFVDVLDILLYILEVGSWSPNLRTETIQNLKWEGQCLSRQTAGKLINYSRVDPFLSVTGTTTLLDVVRIFAEGIHRVVVMESGRVTNVISQFDLVHFLATRGVWIGSALEKSLGQVGLESQGVLSVLDSVEVIDVLRFIYENKVSGVPVVDKKGMVVGSFSATDLLGMTEDNFAFLTMPVKDYLMKIYGFPKPPVCCREFSTVEDLLLKIVVHKVHRVFIVNEKMRPTGVLSLTDIMKFLLAN